MVYCYIIFQPWSCEWARKRARTWRCTVEFTAKIDENAPPYLPDSEYTTESPHYRAKIGLLGSDASRRGRPRTDRYMSVSSTSSSHSRNRDSVSRGFVRVSITPIRSWAMKSTSNHML